MKRSNLLERPALLASTVAVLATLGAASLAQAQVIVSPNALASADGNAWFQLAPVPPSLRFMQLFDKSEFSSLPGPVWITSIAFRPDVAQQQGPATASSPGFQYYLSTTSRSVAFLSTTFADNVGPDNTLVANYGPYSYATANLPGPGNTRSFDFVIPFTTPFLYDPAAGSLLLDVHISEVSLTSGTLFTSDGYFNTALSAPGRSIRSMISQSELTGEVVTGGLVNQFGYQPVPEPSSLLLVGVVLTCGWFARRGRGTQNEPREGS